MQYTNLIWRNGQPYSEMFDDIYYSSDENENISGECEFNHVFFKNNGLPERWSEKRDFVIAELGFGSGLNCILTIREWLKFIVDDPQHRCLHYIALEKYPLSPDSIISLLSRYPELKHYCDALIESYPPAVEGSHSRHLFGNQVVIHYKFNDAYEALKKERYNVDAWYLDGFSPAKNKQMWTLALFEKIAQNSHLMTTCSTYTAAGYVKRNLQCAGFEVNKVNGYGSKREMLVAVLETDQRIIFNYDDKPWFEPSLKSACSMRQATVIGAGIAGLSVAYSLAKRGLTVTVIDTHGEGGRGASSNPAAIVYPRLSVDNAVDTEFYLQAYFYTLHVLSRLKGKHRDDFWFDSGLLQFIDKKRISGILRKLSLNENYAGLTEIANDAALNKYLKEKTELACIEYKAAGVVSPQVLCDVLQRECGDQVSIIKAKIDNVEYDNEQWKCFDGDRLVQECGTLVVANGTQINKLSLDIAFPVESVRGQVAAIEVNSEQQEIIQTVNADIYFTPFIRDRHFLGATYSRDDANIDVKDNDNQKLISGLNVLYPDVYTTEGIVDSWVGFRTMSKDRVPIVGAVPDVTFFKQQYFDINHGKKEKEYLPARYSRELYISAAHGSRGFTTSFLSAEIIVAQICGEPSPVSRTVLDFLSPSRFIVNDLKRG